MRPAMNLPSSGMTRVLEQKFLNKFRGGLAGNGIAKNILQGYKFIVDNYEQDDLTYLFGFSRGAYTARSLAGLIRNIGILHKSSAPAVELENNPVLMNGFRIYQRRDAGPKSVVNSPFGCVGHGWGDGITLK